jgi:hypothetical protein
VCRLPAQVRFLESNSYLSLGFIPLVIYDLSHVESQRDYDASVTYGAMDGPGDLYGAMDGLSDL